MEHVYKRSLHNSCINHMKFKDGSFIYFRFYVWGAVLLQNEFEMEDLGIRAAQKIVGI